MGYMYLIKEINDSPILNQDPGSPEVPINASNSERGEANSILQEMDY